MIYILYKPLAGVLTTVSSSELSSSELDSSVFLAVGWTAVFFTGGVSSSSELSSSELDSFFPFLAATTEK
jgi:hypothetical protein